MFGKASLKLAVIGSSLLLVGGFVSYRAGAFDRFFGAGDGSQTISSELIGGSKSAEVFGEFEERSLVSPADDPAAPQPDAMIYSTKSSPMIEVHKGLATTPPTPPVASPPPSDRVLQAGSKAMMIDLTPPPSPNPEPDSAPNGRPPAFPQDNARKAP